MRRAIFVRSTAAAYAAAGLPTALGAAATVKIGYIDSFSGGLADIENHHRTAMEIAIDEANRRGRVRYELVAADDTSKPANGTIEARRLIGQENVDVLMVGTSSAVTLAVAPLAEQTGIFMLAIGGQDTSITGEKAQRVVYRFAPNVRMQITAFGQRILSLGKKWYFIVDDFAYGR
ncbi:MAG: ABC transporter substrate-binding protein, partial [Candidatus Eremiobacteraeota bacterium]|nr:ABC transporter substrate-binding protein [Candidatus Eremiobacteraeota bacterium]